MSETGRSSGPRRLTVAAEVAAIVVAVIAAYPVIAWVNDLVAGNGTEASSREKTADGAIPDICEIATNERLETWLELPRRTDVGEVSNEYYRGCRWTNIFKDHPPTDVPYRDLSLGVARYMDQGSVSGENHARRAYGEVLEDGQTSGLVGLRPVIAAFGTRTAIDDIGDEALKSRDERATTVIAVFRVGDLLIRVSCFEQDSPSSEASTDAAEAVVDHAARLIEAKLR